MVIFVCESYFFFLHVLRKGFFNAAVNLLSCKWFLYNNSKTLQAFFSIAFTIGLTVQGDSVVISLVTGKWDFLGMCINVFLLCAIKQLQWSLLNLVEVMFQTHLW